MEAHKFEVMRAIALDDSPHVLYTNTALAAYCNAR